MLINVQKVQSQDWMTSWEAAKRLALVQNKMIFMMWEEATLQQFPVIVEDSQGNDLIVDDLFNSELLNTKIWEHFVPVSLSESMYSELYDAIKNEREYTYLAKFSDNSVKIMDVNGNILNVQPDYDGMLNLSKLINTYYLNTSILQPDLSNYLKSENFTTAFRLGIKYIDLAMFSSVDAREEVIKLSNLYLEQAKAFMEDRNFESEAGLLQKFELMQLKQQLILNRPKKVLRQLNRLEPAEVDSTNEALVAFLYLTAYRMLGDEESASTWRSQVPLAELEKSKQIIDINR